MWTPEDRALVGDFGCGQALSDDQFRLLEPLIPPPKPGGRPRTTDMRQLLDGLWYVIRTGCQWRHLPPPPAFPPWGTVYGYFRAFIEPGGHDHRHAKRQDDRKRGPRGYDAGKNVKGRKRHIAVDTDGLLLGIVVHAADLQDADGAWDLLKTIKPLYCWLRVVFADSIYQRTAALLACFLLGLTLVIVRRIAGTTGFVVLPRRWVVERTLGWLGRWRRLSKDYEELPEVSEAMVTVAMIRLMLHRLVHPKRKRLPPP